MNVFGIEKLSMVDYDGKIAATIFTGGCNFRCPFCHNSSLVLDYQTLLKIDEQEVLAYLEKRKGLLDGICVSGGEPTLQKDLSAFLEKVKKLGYSIKLDTNGTNPNTVKSLKENGLVDYFAMDIKNSKEDYAKIIGFDSYDTTNVEKTVELFLGGDYDYEFRTTLIKEYHPIENIKAIGEWIKGAKKYFLQKYIDSDTCILGGLSPVSESVAKDYVTLLKNYIPNTNLRGY